MWNEEPYFANLIPIIFVFTFVYSIILYAFSKVTEGNMLVSNHMIKISCFRSDRGGCPKSRIAPFAIVYFGKKYYLTVAKTKHYSNG